MPASSVTIVWGHTGGTKSAGCPRMDKNSDGLKWMVDQCVGVSNSSLLRSPKSVEIQFYVTQCLIAAAVTSL
jgi:hypothetical protein